MPEGASTLLFEHPSRRIRRRELRAFLTDLAERLDGRAVTCLITTDDRLRDMNRKFRGKDYATDVLSFQTSPACKRRGPLTLSQHAPKARKPRLLQVGLGELAISLDRAVEQAAALGHSVEEELRIL